MRRPPQAPSATQGAPSCIASTGHILASGRLPGAIELARPGVGSNHIIALFITMPVRGSTTFEPKRDSKVLVSATILPARSTTERCVVLDAAGMTWPSVAKRWAKASRRASAYARKACASG